MSSLIIPFVFLMITMSDENGNIGQGMAPVYEGRGQCEYIKATFLNDEAASVAAEDEMDFLDVQPRAKLIAVDCEVIPLSVPFLGQSAVM